MGISNLTNGVGFTGIMLSCWKMNGNQRDFWEKCNLNPTRKDRLFNPRHMELFTNSFAENLGNNGSLNFIQVMAAMRHKYIDDLLDKLIKTNVGQVIILGAGFDTRACLHSNANFFEVDFKEVMEIKREIYKENNIEPNAKYISIDYVKDKLIESFREARVNFEAPTVFVYEGNSMHNSKAAINKVFNQINQSFKDYYVVMDYFSENFINVKTGIPEHDLAMQNNSNINATLINGYDDIDVFVNSNNLKLSENVSMEQLAFKYGIHDNPHIPEMKDYFILTACNIKTNIPK